MKVLLVNQYYPPDASATATMAHAAVTALHHAGHDVTVVAGRPSYDVEERHPWRPMRRVSDANAGVVLQVGSSARDRTTMTGRIANYLSFVALAAPVIAARRADVVIAMTDPPLVPFIAGPAAALRRRPFVYWVQDLHPDFAVASEMLREGRLTSTWRWAHRRVLRRAAAVVALGDDMADRLERAGSPASSIRIVRNGAAPRRLPVDEVGASIDLGKDYEFVLVHAGNLGSAGSFDNVITAMSLLDADQFGMVFIGDGAERGRLERRAALVANVHFRDRCRFDELVPALMAADMLVVSVRRGAEGTTVPTKLYDALATGRPVLAIAGDESDVARLVRRHRCGLVADPDDPAAIASAIREARVMGDGLAAMGRQALAAARHYDRTSALRRLVEIVEAAGAAR